MIANTFDIPVPVQTNVADTSASKSADSSDGKQFESMLQENANSSSQSGDNTTDKGVENGDNTVTKDESVGSGELTTEVQQELLLAMVAPIVEYRPVEIVQTLVEDGEIDFIAPEVEIDVQADVEPELLDVGTFEVVDEELLVTTDTSLFELEETFVELEVSLEEFEVPTEINVETEEVEIEEAPLVETEEDIEVVETSDTEDNDFDKETSKQPTTEVKKETNEFGPVTEKVFDKVTYEPVKVGETVDTTRPDMDEQLSKIIVDTLEAGENTVTVLLNPEGLGSVTIQVTQQLDGALQVILQVTDDAAAKLLQNHVNQLTQTLQGNSNSSVSVEVQTEESDSQGQEGFDHEENGSNRRDDERENDDDDGEIVYSEDFMQQLRLGLKQFTLDI